VFSVSARTNREPEGSEVFTAVKLLKPDNTLAESCLYEVGILADIAKIEIPKTCAMVPKVVFHDETHGQYFGMVPVGTLLAASEIGLRPTHVRQTLQLLSILHSHHIFHRDLRPSNLMWDSVQQRVLLIDFGCAVHFQSGEVERVVYAGAFRQASTSILRHIGHGNANSGLYLFTAADDLECFVHTIFSIMFPRLVSCELDQLEHTSGGALMAAQFWDESLNNEVWSQAVRAARACEYDTLSGLLCSFLPSDSRSTTSLSVSNLSLSSQPAPVGSSQ
jgi:serine/threonine protein kinase